MRRSRLVFPALATLALSATLVGCSGADSSQTVEEACAVASEQANSAVSAFGSGDALNALMSGDTSAYTDALDQLKSIKDEVGNPEVKGEITTMTDELQTMVDILSEGDVTRVGDFTTSMTNLSSAASSLSELCSG